MTEMLRSGHIVLNNNWFNECKWYTNFKSWSFGWGNVFWIWYRLEKHTSWYLHPMFTSWCQNLVVNLKHINRRIIKNAEKLIEAIAPLEPFGKCKWVIHECKGCPIQPTSNLSKFDGPIKSLCLVVYTGKHSINTPSHVWFCSAFSVLKYQNRLVQSIDDSFMFR